MFVPLRYLEPLYRPPSEADNLIIQATYGCSFNRCSFCSMYRSKDYTPRPLDDVFDDIETARRAAPGTRRVFLADGDALVLPTGTLVAILERLAAAFPGLTRVSCYAMPQNLLRKTPDELAMLRARRLTLVYFGMESGSALILRKITKGATPDMMAEALEKAREASIKVSATVILGLGGERHWEEHVAGTVDLVNRTAPNYLSTLQLGLADDVEEEFLHKFEKIGGDAFEWRDDEGMLEEQEHLLSGFDPPRPVIFRSNHASNALALAGNLPKDRDRLVAEVRAARRGDLSLRPWFLRGY